MYQDLATYRRLVERLTSGWADFQARRQQRLAPRERFGRIAERATEQILEDLFTGPLDWELSDLNLQVDYADMLLTRHGVRHLVVEAKRPGALAWNRVAVEAALDQAAGYARKQKVSAIAVSDGRMFFATDLVDGGMRDRVYVSLNGQAAPHDLWWVSVHGIYRPPEVLAGQAPTILPAVAPPDAEASVPADGVVHPRYKLPARCFAYVGDSSKPRTWHLPYRLADGTPDHARLPKAVQSILTDYRGVQTRAVPERAVPDVLDRLEAAARELGKMPDQCGGATAPIYHDLEHALDQFGLLG